MKTWIIYLGLFLAGYISRMIWTKLGLLDGCGVGQE